MTVTELRDILFKFNGDSLVEATWGDENPETGSAITKVTVVTDYEDGKKHELIVIRAE